MSHVNGASQRTILGRIPILRAFIVRTPAGPIVDRRAKPRPERSEEPVPRVRLALPLSLVTDEIPEKDAFVLSRMDGTVALDELFSLCPMPAFEVLRVLDRWAEKKLVVLA